MKKLLFIFLILLLTGCARSNAISGNYKCYNLDGETYYGAFAFDVKFGSDKTFEYTQGEGTARGTYTYKRLKKDGEKDVNAKYYTANIKLNSITVAGEKQDASTELEWEIGLEGGKKDNIIIGANAYVFVCKRDK